MVELKQRVLGQAFVQEYLETLRSGSVGLVFAGGGGKGAYEGGALLALYDCGLSDYEAIAGTSVGALNAALAHQLFRTKDRGTVARLWADLSPQRILSWNRFRIPLAVLMRIGIFLFAALVGTGSLLLALLESKKSARANLWRGTLYRAKNVTDLILTGLLTAIVLLILLALRGWPLEFQLAYNISSISFLAALGLFMTRNFVGQHLSLASNGPLRQLIRDSIEIGLLRRTKPPVYCTMASETTWWEPFEVSKWSSVSDGAQRCFRKPVYLNLVEAGNDEEAIDWLLQTAALPEIFPRKPVRGRYTVDGGLLDNVPIYPVAMHHPDWIIVVYLDSRVADDKGFYAHEAARTWWMAESKARSELDTRRKANQVRRRQIERHGPIGEDSKPNLIPLEPRLLTPQQFLFIVPSESLGNLFTGTLNFSAKKARRLLGLGYKDGLLWIESFAKHNSLRSHPPS